MNESEIRNILGDEIASPAQPGGNSEHSMGVIERRGVDRLFLEYYGLIEQPFGVTPDLRFLYLGAKHRQALDVLNYGTELNRGFLTLIAEAGMGKTSLLFQYLEGLRGTARTVFLFQTDADSTELMRYLLADLGIDGKGMDLPEMRAVLSQILMGEMEAGRRFVLVIDEAQNLSEQTLESIRLLSNFETPWMKLLHIVLAGQPQLGERLAKPSMKQLRQRVSFAVHLEPFTREEADLYIDHRLWVAGYKGAPLFSVGARALLAERSEGIPRNINNLCFCAMSYAWAMKRKTIDRDTMSEVLADLDPEQPVEKRREEPPAPPMQKKEEPKLAVSLLSAPASLSAGSSQPRSSLVKVALFCLAAVLLGWIGVQPEVGKWMGSTAHAMSSAVHNYLGPSSAGGQGGATTAAPENSPASLQSDSPTNTNATAGPQQGAADPSPFRVGQN
jgi:general secretion pathway protein A